MLVYSKAEVDTVLKGWVDVYATKLYPSKEDRAKLSALDCVRRYIGECKIYWADSDDLYSDDNEVNK